MTQTDNNERKLIEYRPLANTEEPGILEQFARRCVQNSRVLHRFSGTPAGPAKLFAPQTVYRERLPTTRCRRAPKRTAQNPKTPEPHTLLHQHPQTKRAKATSQNSSPQSPTAPS